MTPREYDEWIEFFTLEPFGSRADDVRAMKMAMSTAPLERDIDPSLFVGEQPEEEVIDDGRDNPMLDPKQVEQTLQLLAIRQRRIHRGRVQEQRESTSGTGSAGESTAEGSTE